MTNVEVDQSGRMEMSGDTTVAVSDGFTSTVRVTGKVKQEVREALRDRGVKPRMVMIRMFVGAILLAAREHLGTISKITVDDEYIGYEAEIRSLLLDRIRSLGHEVERGDVAIIRIGRQSPAHRAAIRVTRREARANSTPTAEQLLEVC